jgi:hypothetical protein
MGCFPYYVDFIYKIAHIAAKMWESAYYSVRVMIMGQDLNKEEELYDSLAKEYAETFSGEHEKKPKDQEILHRFSQDLGDGIKWTQYLILD